MGKSGKKNKKQTADLKEAASKDPNNPSKKTVRNKPNNKYDDVFNTFNF